MCGIVFGFGFSYEKFIQGQSKIFHRGPDSSSSLYLTEETLFFGFQRLAIQDLSLKGSQPFWSSNKRYLILYNGEIYNKEDLVLKYLSNFQLKTNADTEIIAEVLESVGVRKTLNLLEGMFALCIYDTFDKKTFLARDYFGVKRLYWYASSSKEFVAASEIQSILGFISNPRPNIRVIHDWLYHGLIDHSENTFFQEIKVIPAGHLMEIDEKGSIKIEDWREKIRLSSFDNEEQYLQELNNCLFSLVEKSLVGEANMGVLLSGGVDSSLFYAIANRFQSKMQAFTLDWNNQEYSELDWVRKITNPKHHNIVTSDEREIFQQIPKSIKHYCQPFGSPFLIGLEKIFEKAKEKEFKVMFDGNGLDELFLGYSKYRMKLNVRNFSSLTQDSTNGLRPGLLGSTLNDCHEFNCEHFQESENLDLNKMRNLDIFTLKLPRALRYSDQASMKHSCELRVPFVNKELYAMALSANLNWLQDDLMGKKPIRKILGNLTNKAVGFEKKRAVQLPMREWFVNNWEKEVISTINESVLFKEKWINIAAFNEEYRKFKIHYSKDNSNALFLWQWLSLALWSNEFIR